MVGHIGLYYGTSRLCPAASSHHLGNKRKGPLIAAKIPRKKRLVSVKDSCKGDIGKVKTLGYHLSTYHYIVFAVSESGKALVVGVS